MCSVGVEACDVALAAPERASGPTPFSLVRADISKEDLIRLRADLRSWQALHGRAVEREAVLKEEIETLRARIRYLEQQLFGRKSERSGKGDRRRSDQAGSEQQKLPRGQQPGAPGHGRTRLDHLPAEDEVADLDEADKRCPCCGKPLLPIAGTEDSEVLEIEVRAYRRRIHRQRYQPGCSCGKVAGIVTAPAPNRLIAKGKLGISLWVEILLDKFLYACPTNRLLHNLRGHDLPLAAGTVACRRDRLAGLLADRRQGRASLVLLAVPVGDDGAAPARSVARGDGAESPFQDDPGRHHRVRPLRRLQEDGPRGRRPIPAGLLLGPCAPGFPEAGGHPVGP